MTDKEILPIDIDEITRNFDNGGYIVLRYDVLIRKYNMPLEEAAIFSLIYGFCKNCGSCKLSAGEIGKRLGIKSRQTVSKYIGTLLLRGLITVKPILTQKGKAYELFSNIETTC